VATCVGRKARHPFVVDEAAMDRFRQMSGDNSRIHCDDTFARSMGYDGVIVYGGIMLAHLSQLLGMNIPGMNATSISWSIRYHKPLYIGEAAEILFEVVNVSPATGLVEGRFRIAAGDKEVATGKTQSIVPPEEIEV
jgi:acyl dehydratase